MKDQANEQQIGPVMRPSLSRIDREMLRAILKYEGEITKYPPKGREDDAHD